ncbi:unnamed protein product [Acidithrix sp. C25]|nr:unnamed protein product [Acidithrix sp. C25]
MAFSGVSFLNFLCDTAWVPSPTMDTNKRNHILDCAEATRSMISVVL